MIMALLSYAQTHASLELTRRGVVLSCKELCEGEAELLPFLWRRRRRLRLNCFVKEGRWSELFLLIRVGVICVSG